jgi:hypothetical protein
MGLALAGGWSSYIDLAVRSCFRRWAGRTVDQQRPQDQEVAVCLGGYISSQPKFCPLSP